MINTKWFNAIFCALGLLVLIIGRAPEYWYIKLAFLLLLYIVILSFRNNYIWYFCFEFAILAVFLLGGFLIDQHPNAMLWCMFTAIGLGVLYLIIVKIMDTRGYPIRKQINEEKE